MMGKLMALNTEHEIGDWRWRTYTVGSDRFESWPAFKIILSVTI